jgi:hypothetical protein
MKRELENKYNLAQLYNIATKCKESYEVFKVGGHFNHCIGCYAKGATTFIIMTLSLMTLSIMTLSVMTLSTKD